MAKVDTLNEDAPRGGAKKEAFHREAESRRRPFAFRRPDVPIEGRKGVFYLGHSDIMSASIQIIPEGGDNTLHYHPGGDGFWMVLKGKIRFYGPDGVIGEYGPNEGILMPRNARYWFEVADLSEELHLLHIQADIQPKVKNGHINLEEKKPGKLPNMRFNYPPGVRVND
jgi:mannose-6-phosphate isomerase-like protein (cupin superfamily)